MAELDRVEKSSHSLDKSITLPPDEIFRNLENAKRFAIDIGTGRPLGRTALELGPKPPASSQCLTEYVLLWIR